MAREDLELGPCQVSFGTEGAEVDLGCTDGGVTVSFITDAGDLMCDQFGTQPVDQVITGQGAEVRVPLAEITLDNLALALNQTVISDALIEGENLVGTKMSTYGQSLLLRKYVDGEASADPADWMRFPVAAPLGSPEVSFSRDTQRVIEVVFKCFPDSNDILYYIGDESAS